MFENKVLEKKKIKIKRRTVFVGCYLVFKLFAVNGLATSAIMVCKVTALAHLMKENGKPKEIEQEQAPIQTV